MKTPLRLGIVGCGAVVRAYHLPTLMEMPGVVVAALCDKDKETAVSTGKFFGLRASITDDFTQLAGTVEAALVATPPRSHAPITVELLRQGVDVLCEKPLAASTAEAGLMVEAAKQHGRVLAVGLMTRFLPCNEIMQTILKGDLLGEILEISAEQGRPLEWIMTSDAFYNSEFTAGGVLLDIGTHMLDRVIWLFGKLDNLQLEDDSYGGQESNAVLRGTLAVGGKEVPCNMAFSWTHILRNSICVRGTKASAEMRLEDPDAVFIRQLIGGELLEMRASRLARRPHPAGFDVFRREWEDFVAAVESRREPFVPAASALECLRVIDKAYSVRKRMAQPWVEA
jgi:predicted dehydrogenase